MESQEPISGRNIVGWILVWETRIRKTCRARRRDLSFLRGNPTLAGCYLETIPKFLYKRFDGVLDPTFHDDVAFFAFDVDMDNDVEFSEGRESGEKGRKFGERVPFRCVERVEFDVQRDLGHWFARKSGDQPGDGKDGRVADLDIPERGMFGERDYGRI